MNLDKEALDRYITNEPSDGGYNSWVESVMDAFSNDHFIKVYGESIWFEGSALESRWFERFFVNEYKPEDAARIIERAFSILSADIEEALKQEYRDAVLHYSKLPADKYEARTRFYNDIIDCCRSVPLTIPQAGRHIQMAMGVLAEKDDRRKRINELFTNKSQ